MEKVTQVILRNRTHLAGGKILLVNPARDAGFREISGAGREVKLFSQDFAEFRWLREAGADVAFGAFPETEAQAEQIILRLPREKERLNMMLHCCARLLGPGGTLWLVGEIRSGIKSSIRYLSQYFENTRKLDSARHCVLFESSTPLPGGPFDPAEYRRRWALQTGAGQITLVSLPGAFSHGRLDSGTKLLLETVWDAGTGLTPAGKVLDFGCGAGVIGLSLLARDPTMDLTLLDSSALALESARLSLEANGLDAHLVASDGLSDIRARFDWIVSNPPFHSGVEHNLEIARSFFSGAGRALANQGRILLVCNRHLPYARWLQEHFGEVAVIRSESGYDIISACRPRGE